MGTPSSSTGAVLIPSGYVPSSTKVTRGAATCWPNRSANRDLPFCTDSALKALAKSQESQLQPLGLKPQAPWRFDPSARRGGPGLFALLPPLQALNPVLPAPGKVIAQPISALPLSSATARMLLVKKVPLWATASPLELAMANS